MPDCRTAYCIVTLLLLSSCAPDAADDSGTPSPAADPIFVYAAYADSTYLPAFVDAFQKQTGATVIVRTGDPAAIVDDVIGGHVSPPADLLITPGVAGVWRAAEEGALRPLQSALVRDRTVAWLRDPDAFWTAWNYRRAVIAYHPDRTASDGLDEFGALAEPRFKGRLCLASATDSISLAVIAMLLDELGNRDTELMVRGWVANLAIPPLATEEDALRAIGSGVCDVAIVSSATFAFVANSQADLALRMQESRSLFVDIEGLGIARHARNPDGARSLIEWLLDKQQQDRHAVDVFAEADTAAPAGHASVSRVARNREDALKLAERARYR